MSVTYELDQSCQTEIVSCMAFDTDFHRRSDGLIDPSYFESPPEQTLARMAVEHYATYREVPSNTAWIELMKDGIKSGRIKPGDAREVVEKLQELGGLVVRSRQFLLDKIEEFAVQQAIMNSMMVAAKLISKPSDPDRFKKIKKTMSEAFQVGLHVEDDDYDYWERIEERTQYRQDILSGKRAPAGITTGVRELDDLLMHRGWGRKELSLIMGGAKSTKSFMLSMFAAHANMAGKNVLLISCENSIQITCNRIDAQLSAIGQDAQFINAVAVEMALKGRVLGAGKLKIRHAPTGTLTPNKIQAWIDDYKTKGIVFDLVVIDYWDILAPSVRSKDNKIEDSASIGRELRAMADIENFALLTATQANREGHKSAVLKAEHVAEDFNRVRLADLVLAISRTDEDKADSKARISFAACRNSADGYVIFCKQDLNMGLAISEVESVE